MPQGGGRTWWGRVQHPRLATAPVPTPAAAPPPPSLLSAPSSILLPFLLLPFPLCLPLAASVSCSRCLSLSVLVFCNLWRQTLSVLCVHHTYSCVGVTGKRGVWAWAWSWQQQHVCVCDASARKTSIKIHKLLFMRIELSDMRMGTATPRVLTHHTPQKLRMQRPLSFPPPLAPSPTWTVISKFMQKMFQVVVKKLSPATFLCQ